jgi:hypothetical protein
MFAGLLDPADAYVSELLGLDFAAGENSGGVEGTAHILSPRAHTLEMSFPYLPAGEQRLDQWSDADGQSHGQLAATEERAHLPHASTPAPQRGGPTEAGQ